MVVGSVLANTGAVSIAFLGDLELQAVPILDSINDIVFGADSLNQIHFIPITNLFGHSDPVHIAILIDGHLVVAALLIGKVNGVLAADLLGCHLVAIAVLFQPF